METAFPLIEDYAVEAGVRMVVVRSPDRQPYLKAAIVPMFETDSLATELKDAR